MESATTLAEPPPEPTTTTMATVVGVDAGERYVPAIDLLGRLRFAGNNLTLVHVDPPFGTLLGPCPPLYDVESPTVLERNLRDAGHTLLRDAALRTTRAGLATGLDTVYEQGESSAALMRLADERDADLVAIGSGHHGPLECFFLGSVGRALAIGSERSFLIARGVPKAHGKLRAVFATDHSAYANRCFDRLLDMKPAGIGHVTIMTATESAAETALHGAMGWEDRSTESIAEGRRSMRVLGEAMVGRLGARGIFADYRLVDGYAEEAIRQTMEATSSDLLILGARGHGLLARMLIGSLALHAVVAEPYPVLVLRA